MYHRALEAEPAAMFALVKSPEMKPIAEEVGRRLERVLAAL